MTTTHTAGPWHCVPTDGEPGAGITGFGVLACPEGDEEGALIADGLTEADAKVMAAAPEMLAALELIEVEKDYFRQRALGSDRVNAIRAAIRKAGRAGR